MNLSFQKVLLKKVDTYPSCDVNSVHARHMKPLLLSCSTEPSWADGGCPVLGNATLSMPPWQGDVFHSELLLHSPPDSLLLTTPSNVTCTGEDQQEDSGLQHLLLFYHRCRSVVEAGKTKRYLDPPDCPHQAIVLNQKLISHGIRTV